MERMRFIRKERCPRCDAPRDTDTTYLAEGALRITYQCDECGYEDPPEE